MAIKLLIPRDKIINNLGQDIKSVLIVIKVQIVSYFLIYTALLTYLFKDI